MAEKLREKGLVAGDDGALELTAAGELLAYAYHAERPDHYGYDSRRFDAAANASKAHSPVCERAFGRDLGQEGMVDMEPLDDLLNRFKLGSDDAGLDPGCGSGGMSEYISDQTGAHVTGIDISPSAIEVARQRTADKRNQLGFLRRN